MIVTAIYLLARNQNRNHGPVPPEAKWWAEQARLRKEQERAYRNAHGGRGSCSTYRRD